MGGGAHARYPLFGPGGVTPARQLPLRAQALHHADGRAEGAALQGCARRGADAQVPLHKLPEEGRDVQGGARRRRRLPGAGSPEPIYRSTPVVSIDALQAYMLNMRSDEQNTVFYSYLARL